MTVQERLIERVKQLEPEAALRLYDMALSYRREPEPTEGALSCIDAMERSRRVLAGFEGSLAEDVLAAREDRV